MATKEEIEKERNKLKDENEKLLLRNKELSTKLKVSRYALQSLSSVLDEFLSEINLVNYDVSESQERDFPEPQNEIQ